jgi:hypothetical protein
MMHVSIIRTRYLAAALALAVCADVHASVATVRFSPGGSLDLLVSTIKSAKREIDWRSRIKRETRADDRRQIS